MFGLSLISDEYVMMLKQRISDLESAIDDLRDQLVAAREVQAPLRELGTPPALIPFQPRKRVRQILAELAAKERIEQPPSH